MAGTNWKSLFRETLGKIHRELKITITPVPVPDKWIFVVGCYNSGTTLLAEVLASHPLISGLPAEGQYLTDQFPSDHEIGLSRMWTEREDIYRLKADDTGPDVIRLKKEWGMRFDLKKKILLEKTPANAARMPWLQKHFDNSYFVAIVRNGYAVAEGIKRKAKPIHRKQGWPIDMAARQWSRTNEVILEDSGLLDNFYLVRYEDLVSKPQQVLEDLYRFLELPETGPVNTDKTWQIHEKDEKIRDFNKESIGRLTSEEIQIINGIAGSMLDQLKYERI